jgi:putative DNA primase/helicase
MNLQQYEAAFSKWLYESGYSYDEVEIEADGDWHNFAAPDKPDRATRSAKLTCSDKKIEGVVKDFRTGNKILGTWHHGNGAAPHFTDEELQALAEENKRKADEKKAAQKAALKQAKTLYDKSPAATADHGYLKKKGITDIAELKVNEGGELLVPIYNARTDKFQTVQRIWADGTKLFPPNGVKAGGYAMPKSRPRMTELWPDDNRDPIVICEGYATAYAIQSAVPRYNVVAAIDCGNLKAVAETLHGRFPLRPIIFAADNDIKPDEPNYGVEAATKAAREIEGHDVRLAVPPPGDFWDLWHSEGDAAVRKLINEAVEPPAIEEDPFTETWDDEHEDAKDPSPDPPPQDPPPKQQTKQRNGKSFTLVCAKDIIIRPKQWIWEGHLLRGALDLMSGIPGLGKSQTQIDLIARVTAGLKFPDGTKGVSPGNVIMMTAEDTLDQEVVPRLLAAKANIDRVHIFKCIRSDGKDRQFLLGEDLDMIEKAVAQVGEVALITIDPITAYMGGKIDSHKTVDVRNQLGPLKDLAEKVDVATSAITHPAKNPSQQAIDQFIGSQAFIAAARIGHVCIREVAGEENKETGRVLFANAKNNPHTIMPTLAYRIIEATVGQDEATRTSITAPHIVWDGVVDITANQAVQAASAANGGSKKDDGQKRAIALIEEMLGRQDAVAAKDIYAEGAKRGLSEDQIKRAKSKISSLVSEQTSDGWKWKIVI